MPEPYFQLALALLTGGASVKFLELLFGRGKSLRDELRSEIARLEGRIKALDTKVDALEVEVEEWKDKAQEWRNRFYELQQRYQSALLQMQIKDEHIRRLRILVRQLHTRLMEAAPDAQAPELFTSVEEELDGEP